MLGSQAFDSFSHPDTRSSEQQPKERGGRPLLKRGGGEEEHLPRHHPSDFEPQGAGQGTASARVNRRQGVGQG